MPFSIVTLILPFHHLILFISFSKYHQVNLFFSPLPFTLCVVLVHPLSHSLTTSDSDEDDRSSISSSPQKTSSTRRKRTAFSNEQLLELESEFQQKEIFISC